MPKYKLQISNFKLL